MSTRQLIADLDALEQKLNLQRATLKLNTRQRMLVLKRISPVWLVLGGLATGAVAGRLLKSGENAAYVLTLGGLKVWRLYSLVMPSLRGAASE